MKLLKIEGECGHFLIDETNYRTIDKIGKEDLLRLVDWTLEKDVVEFDPYDEKAVKPHAHQVIYKSIYQKLSSLKERKKEFIDESARLYLDEYEKYSSELKK
ncbi:MAG: hypothetical protein KIT18_08820 [Burkholderiales bacterium]|nr:hypothetical protein [Burkholderiales bacterium]